MGNERKEKTRKKNLSAISHKISYLRSTSQDLRNNDSVRKVLQCILKITPQQTNIIYGMLIKCNIKHEVISVINLRLSS